MSKKKKKEKIIYYDDNSTISDMSNLPKNQRRSEPKELEQRPDYIPSPKKMSTPREKWKTYFSAVKMMIIPMCVVLLIIAVLYLILIFIGKAAA